MITNRGAARDPTILRKKGCGAFSISPAKFERIIVNIASPLKMSKLWLRGVRLIGIFDIVNYLNQDLIPFLGVNWIIVKFLRFCLFFYASSMLCF